MGRQVAAHANMRRQHIVAVGAVDQRAECGIGEARTAVACDRADHVAVAVLDQHLGHGFAEPGAFGDGEQMELALGLGVEEEIAVVEPFGLAEHR
jgi:hypothetical protein